MRAKLMLLVIGFQLLVLGYMAGEREWVLRRGELIYLRTAPMDPVDPFRGNYVRLDYDISRVPTNQLRGGLTEISPEKAKHGSLVYAALLPTEGGVARLDYLSDAKPASGLFLRGRVDRYWQGSVLPVRYGLEAFFAQPDKAKKMEDLRRRGEVQVPLEMEVAVSGKGLSVMKGYRWCRLGIGTKLEMVSSTNRSIRAVTITLMNVSTNTLAVVDPKDGHSLSLEADPARSWGNHHWQWVGLGRSLPVVTDADVVVLKPGDSHLIRVDLTQPEWFVTADKTVKSMPELQDSGSMFRLIYHSPTMEQCRSLKNASLIWHGDLPSRAFGGGRVD